MDAGVIEASAYMAIGMLRHNHAVNARKCWDRFFRQFSILPDSTRASWGFRYCLFMPLESVTAEDRDALRTDRDAILSLFVDRQLRAKAQVALSEWPDLPKRRGRVTHIDTDGSIMIRYDSALEAVDPGRVLATVKVGQEVEFVVDPDTGRIGAVRPPR